MYKEVESCLQNVNSVAEVVVGYKSVVSRATRDKERCQLV